jgi:hypothetical protein
MVDGKNNLGRLLQIEGRPGLFGFILNWRTVIHPALGLQVLPQFVKVLMKLAFGLHESYLLKDVLRQFTDNTS